MRKNKSQKRLVYLVASILLCMTLIAASVIVKNNIDRKNQQIKLNELVTNEENDVKLSFPNSQKQESTIGTNKVIVFLPDSPDNVITKKIVTNEEIVKQQLNNTKDAVVILKAKKNQVDEQIDAVEVMADYYSFVDKEYTKKDSQTINQFYVNHQEQKILTLKDIFPNEEAVKKLMINEVEQTIDNQEQKDKLVEFLTATNINDLDYHITTDKIEIHMIDDKKETLTIPIPLDNLMPLINPKFAQGVFLTSYTNYQDKLVKQKNRKMIALTFDDGPNAKTTPQALDILKKFHAKATFFILGKNVAGNEELLKRMVEEGHQLGNHSYSHPELTKITDDELYKQIYDTQAIIKAASGGVEPHVLRPPYGSYNHQVASIAKIPAINWSIDTLDWQSHDPIKINEIIKKQAYSGAIVLMHDVHQTTINSLNNMLEFLSKEGYEFVTIDELMQGQTLDPMTLYFDRTDAKSYQ
ncbi:Peptidoglycan/xylan/chitin deacetylase, PgdA/CDA1 family [Granulicatella balaenopterae]|uniref:Peptidoglycan/xylan/chitin deacetylase, PgdA/CDA1 family n=1 Tax=Granulicatella balaenopterae TaxID=137733 RepID=A0A1H9I9K9_9LACT|nr:polysaccharide deacetylase family protein [Granulicatella balaenopterae]SEQ71249.1 Peptidoglycan/xylan/chitin deacetylase, PgdA/CDA1 family [Granulicatella balaenopterae]